MATKAEKIFCSGCFHHFQDIFAPTLFPFSLQSTFSVRAAGLFLVPPCTLFISKYVSVIMWLLRKTSVSCVLSVDSRPRWQTSFHMIPGSCLDFFLFFYFVFIYFFMSVVSLGLSFSPPSFSLSFSINSLSLKFRPYRHGWRIPYIAKAHSDRMNYIRYPLSFSLPLSVCLS